MKQEHQATQEEEVSAMVGYVVRDLDGHLFKELMEAMRLK
jgi:hypothetical protein